MLSHSKEEWIDVYNKNILALLNYGEWHLSWIYMITDYNVHFLMQFSFFNAILNM